MTTPPRSKRSASIFAGVADDGFNGSPKRNTSQI